MAGSSPFTRSLRIRRLLVVVIERVRLPPRVGGDHQLVAVLIEPVDEAVGQATPTSRGAKSGPKAVMFRPAHARIPAWRTPFAFAARTVESGSISTSTRRPRACWSKTARCAAAHGR